MGVHTCRPENRAQSCAGAEALRAKSEPTMGAGMGDLPRREGCCPCTAEMTMIRPKAEGAGERIRQGSAEGKEGRVSKATSYQEAALCCVCHLICQAGSTETARAQQTPRSQAM